MFPPCLEVRELKISWFSFTLHLFFKSRHNKPPQTKMIQWNHSPHARESKTVLDSGFCAVELGFPILIVSMILDSLSCIPDSKAQDSGILKEKVPSSRILQAKISLIAESGFPYNSLDELNLHCWLYSIAMNLLTGSSKPTAHTFKSYNVCWTGLLDTTHPPPGVLHYIAYIGMCCYAGYGFWPLCPKQGV